MRLLSLLRNSTSGNLNFNSSHLPVNAQKLPGFGDYFILVFSALRTGENPSVQNNQKGQRLMKMLKDGKVLLLKGPDKDAHCHLCGPLTPGNSSL